MVVLKLILIFFLSYCCYTAGQLDGERWKGTKRGFFSSQTFLPNSLHWGIVPNATTLPAQMWHSLGPLERNLYFHEHWTGLMEHRCRFCVFSKLNCSWQWLTSKCWSYRADLFLLWSIDCLQKSGWGSIFELSIIDWHTCDKWTPGHPYQFLPRLLCTCKAV